MSLILMGQLSDLFLQPYYDDQSDVIPGNIDTIIYPCVIQTLRQL